MPFKFDNGRPVESPGRNPADANCNSHDGEETDSPRWDPAAVQSLINEAYRRGETPVMLCLGRKDAEALKEYLSGYFGEGEEISLKDFVYAGLKIVTLHVDSLLRLETTRFSSADESRDHARRNLIRQQMRRTGAMK